MVSDTLLKITSFKGEIHKHEIKKQNLEYSIWRGWYKICKNAVLTEETASVRVCILTCGICG